MLYCLGCEQKVKFLLSSVNSDLKNVLLGKLTTLLNGFNFVLIAELLHGLISHLHCDEWRQPESFLFLMDHKLGLFYSCVFRGLLFHLMEFVVQFAVKSFCLFIVVSLALYSCIRVLFVFAFYFTIELVHLLYFFSASYL